ncbi:DUF4163 domain-containing protein [Aciduricibacillus chroicocephali]|uniref:DUF4163 domain-containing protein n=1 Tax=Aciduricibacillus chroicocephali TaxID=3054939 RepID=A0ABY9KX29_9BACI|nr:DUF4163 domain-containing protein [Bacillaceae bacterium 44XB]
MKSLVRGIAVLLALLILLPAVPIAAAEAKTESAKVTVDILNVREKTSANSKKLGTLKKGEKVTVYAKTTSGWSEIRFKKKKAYVSTQYLDFSKPAVKVSSKKYNKLNFLKYPQITMKNKSVEQKINSSLLGHAKRSYGQYVEVMDQEQYDDWCMNESWCYYDYDLSYKTKYNKKKKLSVLFNDYVYMGGAHGYNSVTSYNYNLSNGKRVKLNDILNTKTKRSKVRKYVYNYTKRHPDKFFPDLKLSDIKINNSTQFYYTDGGIYLVFQIYELTAYAYGNPAIKIPSSVYK